MTEILLANVGTCLDLNAQSATVFRLDNEQDLNHCLFARCGISSVSPYPPRNANAK